MQKSIGQKGAELFEAGYKIVPIKTGEKHPQTPRWPEIRATATDVNRWRKSNYYWGFGILGEFSPGIDLDVSDAVITKKLIIWCQQNIGQSPIRMGEAPRVLLPCQPPVGQKLGSLKSNKYVDKKGFTHQIEIKASGSQWVAYSIHKDTKKMYKWYNGDLCSFAPDWLPILNGEKIDALIKYFYTLIPADWQIKAKHKLKPVGTVTAAGEIVDDDIFENYKPPLDIDEDKLKSMLERLNPDSSHDNWLMVGMGLYHQFNGDDIGKNLFIEWSQKSNQFDEKEINDRWPTWATKTYSGNPITAATIVKMYQNAAEKSKDPTRVRKGKNLSDWEKRFGLVELPDGSEVHDMGRPIWQSPRRTLAAFKDHNAAYTHTITLPNGTPKFIPMVDAWKGSLNTRHFAGYTYQPGEKRYCKAEFNYGDSSLYVNTFFFPPHNEVENGEVADRITPFSNFLKHLFPVENERNWIIEWLARMIQQPGTRSFVTPLNITPVTGTGRGLFFEILRRLVGGHNTHDVSRDDLEGRFNGYLDKCIIAVVQEIKAAAGERKYQMWERMKSLLADSTANIQSKGKDSYTSTIRANFILFSNNINALPIEDVNERRIYAMQGADKPIEAKAVDLLLEWMRDAQNMAALFCYLKSYLVNTNHFKRAVVTDTKKQMVVASAGEGKTDLIAWLNTEAPDAFDFDYALEKLSEYSQDIAESGFSRRAMRNAISDHGWRNLRAAIHGQRVYIYYNPNKLAGTRAVRLKYLELINQTKEK